MDALVGRDCGDVGDAPLRVVEPTVAEVMSPYSAFPSLLHSISRQLIPHPFVSIVPRYSGEEQELLYSPTGPCVSEVLDPAATELGVINISLFQDSISRRRFPFASSGRLFV